MEFKSKKLIQQLNANTRAGKGSKGPDPDELKPVHESNKRKWTISGIIVGLVSGIPLGVMVEIWRFISGEEWDSAVIGIIVALVAVVISTVAGYFYGAYLDGGT